MCSDDSKIYIWGNLWNGTQLFAMLGEPWGVGPGELRYVCYNDGNSTPKASTVAAALGLPTQGAAEHMGCASTKLDAIEHDGVDKEEVQEALQVAIQGNDAAALRRALLEARRCGVEQACIKAGKEKLQSLKRHALSAAPEFADLTNMLVMSFATFKAQGRIMKSIQVWRDAALAKGELVIHDKRSSKIVVFISHTWWDRVFKDGTNDPSDPYDKGAPDHQTGKKTNLKWSIICAGVQNLIKLESLSEEDIMLWIDWQSIYQDDKEEKLKGVKSLIQFSTLCDYMLVPTAEKRIKGRDGFYFPSEIPGYGMRGWCRLEYFIFSLLAEMQGLEVPLYAIQRNGSLLQYAKIVGDDHGGDLPSAGTMSNPNDQELIKSLEDKMIEVYGGMIVELKCKTPEPHPFEPDEEQVDLTNKMIRAVHINPLLAAVDKYRVASVSLEQNQIGDEGAMHLAAGLKCNTSITDLNLVQNHIGPDGVKAIMDALHINPVLTTLEISMQQCSAGWQQKTGFGPDGATAIADLLRATSVLTDLSLAVNAIGPDGGKAIAYALCANSSLSALSISHGNDLDKAAMRALRGAIKERGKSFQLV